MLIPSIARGAVATSAAAALLAVCIGCGHTQAAPPPKPPVVEVAQVSEKTVPDYGEWIATLHGYVTAKIQPHITGYLIKQDYQEGSYVAKDSVLFEIDPRPFQAAVDQAKAQVAKAEAELGNATLNVKRDIPEAKAQAIPQSQLDTDKQAELAAKAAVEAAKAALEQAQLNLSYTKVRSLVGGIAGIAQVQVGNLVSPTTVLTSVSQVNPIKAYFPITGEEYLALASRVHGSTTDLLSSGSRIPLELTLSNGDRYTRPGKILFVDRQLDPQTGTIQIVGAFPNPLRLLRPGETGRIRAVVRIDKNSLLVPQRAVSQLQGGYQVAVVGADNKISFRNVQVGQQVGTKWVILQGLKAGDHVVAEGSDKLRDGMKVSPAPYTPSGSSAQAGEGQATPASSSQNQQSHGGH